MTEEELRESQVKNKGEISQHMKELRCPIHNCLIGKYDERVGCVNQTCYCPKCKIEYTFTIKAKKN